MAPYWANNLSFLDGSALARVAMAFWANQGWWASSVANASPASARLSASTKAAKIWAGLSSSASAWASTSSSIWGGWGVMGWGWAFLVWALALTAWPLRPLSLAV